jgi:hypothetical protein
MKKLVLLLVAGFSFTFVEVAQAQKIGIKAGVNYSNLSGDLTDEANNEGKIGLVGGIGTSIPLVGDGFLSLAPELLYSQKGYQYRDDEFMVGNNKIKREGSRSFNYLDLPILLKVNAGGLFFEGGPLASYLLNINDKTKESINGVENNSYTELSKDGLSKFEVGYAAGLGYMTEGGLSLGIRYNGSLNKLANDYNGNDLQNARHSLFQATIGFMVGGN